MGLTVAIVAGLLIGRLGMERYLEDWVREMQSSQSADFDMQRLDWAARIDAGVGYVKEIVGRVWRWILLGIAVGAVIVRHIRDEAGQMLDAEFAIEAGMNASCAVPPAPTFQTAPAACCTPTAKGNACC
jgi:uncharacterized membrane protein YraQ (UPF0718 family)